MQEERRRRALWQGMSHVKQIVDGTEDFLRRNPSASTSAMQTVYDAELGILYSVHGEDLPAYLQPFNQRLNRLCGRYGLEKNT